MQVDPIQVPQSTASQGVGGGVGGVGRVGLGIVGVGGGGKWQHPLQSSPKQVLQSTLVHSPGVGVGMVGVGVGMVGVDGLGGVGGAGQHD